MKKLIFIYMMLIASCCALESKADGVYVGGWSKHVNQKAWERSGYEINQQHDIIIIERDGWEMGHYTNTHFDKTWLAGRYFELFALDDIQLGVHVGASYGYKFCREIKPDATRSVFCPVIMPELRYTRWRVQPALLAISDGVAISFRVDI